MFNLQLNKHAENQFSSIVLYAKYMVMYAKTA